MSKAFPFSSETSDISIRVTFFPDDGEEIFINVN